MKLLSILALALSAAIFADAYIPANEPPASGAQAAGADCDAFAALKIRTFGTVSCKGVAKAECAAIASAEEDMQAAYAVWWDDSDKCQEISIEEVAVAVATACATVYSKSLVQVECTGAGGEACGWAISEGEAFATALAKAVAQAAVDAGGSSASAFCVADVEAVAGTFVDAAAQSQAEACAYGAVSESDFNEAFVSSTSTVITEAMVKASAATCGKEGEAAAQSICAGAGGGQIESETGTETTPGGGAAASGGAGETTMCSPGMYDCCKADYASPICSCTTPDCAGTWMLVSEGGAVSKAWRNPATRQVCQCV